MSIETLFNQTMDVLKNAFQTDTIGGPVNNPVLSSSDNACRIRKLSGRERQLLGREGVVVSHRIYCDAAVDVVENDTIVINNDEYDVELVDDPHLLGHHLEIDAVRRRSGN